MRGVFLDISKPFGKVWHKGLLFKLKSSGIEGELLTLLECYLSNREQRFVSNGQTSYRRKINSGETQGSVLGPLLFLIYINDLTEVITFICKIFAEDTSLFSNVLDTCNSENALNSDIESISSWIYQWKLQFNPDPKKQAKEFIFFFRKLNTYIYPPVEFNNSSITKCPHQKPLCVVLDSKLDFTLHKKWSFPLKISLVNVTKSALSCRFGHIYWRNL